MIDLTYLYAGRESNSTPHRYGRALQDATAVPSGHRHKQAASAGTRKPIVVWNITRTCNLQCTHCYTDSAAQRYSGELTTAEGKALIDDLAAFGIPALLLSGGEPLMRPDFFELADYAVSRGLRLVLSTNGTLIHPETAARLKATGFTYIGISLDGLQEAHDRFRQHAGAFDGAIAGIRNCLAIGQKVGLRLTLSRTTVSQLPGIFELIEREGVPRVCFYHLVPAGRAPEAEALTLPEARAAIDLILEQTRRLAALPKPIEILTVDNHCDGPYLYQKLRAQNDPRAADVLKLLRWNGGALHSSGVGIADVDFQGNVHADQFWMDHTFGNVRQRPFSQIWMDTSDPLMAALKDRRGKITGRCAKCVWFDACGGGLRSRAWHGTGDPWAADPACYLTDEEIAREV